ASALLSGLHFLVSITTVCEVVASFAFNWFAHQMCDQRNSPSAGGGGWSPAPEDQQPWLQLTLRDRLEVTAISTQGRWGSEHWVRRYQLLYSDTGHNWRQYRHESVLWTFTGNRDADSEIHHKLPHSIRTRFLRLVPLQGSPRGGAGLRVELYGCAYKSDVADFDGRSALLYRFNQKSMSTAKDVISLRFRSQQAEGVLVHGAGQKGDFITLELQQGKLVLQLNLDDAKLLSRGGLTSVSLGSLLDDDHWHSVLIERFNKQVNFTLDHHTQHFRTQGQEDTLELDYEISFGGIPLPGKPGTFLKENFHGCLENLYCNGVNVIDQAKRRKPQIFSGNVTFQCSETQPVAVTFHSSDSFLILPINLGMETFSLRLQIRTWNAESLIFHATLDQELQPLILLPYTAFTLYKFDYVAWLFKGSRINDGQWHSVGLDIKDQQIFLSVDRQRPVSADIGLHFCVIQGCPESLNGTGCESCSPMGFQGCMRLIFVNNHPVDLLQVQQGMLGNYNQLDFDVCSIQDRCTPSFCEHGGQCYQSWSQLYCNCSGTGYTGATCHNPIYRQSCEAYWKTGRPSGTYSIDVDGSGPLEPTLVNCSMTVDRAWTVVSHNQTQLIKVRGSTLQSPYTWTLNYTLPLNHLRNLVTTSDHCQQEVVYHCRRSRLFDNWDGTPLSWWVDRDGEKRTYWGGFLPGVQQCSCSLEGNCMDMNYFCNCDADRDTWVNDTGLLSYKDHLPMKEIFIGDTNRTDSEAAFQIGLLLCHGDRYLWNSASFYQGPLYFHIPSLQSDLSVDISFYFKTSSSSGVFLENKGQQDFIRLELSSPSSVTFIFDVGDGPINLTLMSPEPLNDRQWHYVQVDRNVKEALLQVDNLTPQIYGAPHEGHVHLQLSTTLFLGGTASRQRGFQGCLRALTLNGLSLDLEERAKTTPGVSVGCPGHCNSDSVCLNQGRCVEERNSYACDCSHSAHTGPHCRTAVSAAFESSSSVTFNFEERSSRGRSESSKPSPARTEVRRTRDRITFGFMTRHAPAVLLLAQTHTQRYMAILLAKNGSLHIKYHLDQGRGSDMFSPKCSNLANEQLHWIHLNREGLDVSVQVGYFLSIVSNATSQHSAHIFCVAEADFLDPEITRAGFIGCLTSVQYNEAAPLKDALLNHRSSRVRVSGRLSESSCGTHSTPNVFSTTHSLPDQAGKGNRAKEPLKEAAHNESALIGGEAAPVVERDRSEVTLKLT
uniref:Contactin associated protein-like 5a n=1 Tax=Denticeps clupeoides TaxID=299321 RepID=A0AAY4DAE9_9TELE